jgi:hypothetical protein
VLLLARFALSQMDVPTRQAYVMAVVDASERTAAAAYTNTARYLTRTIAPLIAGATLRGALGAPLLHRRRAQEPLRPRPLRSLPQRPRRRRTPARVGNGRLVLRGLDHLAGIGSRDRSP